MNQTGHRRHDISDTAWAVLDLHLPGRAGSWGGKAKNNPQFLKAIVRILRTVAPWRDLPPDYGDWKNTHRRFSRWRSQGAWERLLEIVVQEPDYQWLMIDATHTKVRPHTAGAKGGNQDRERRKGGSTPRYIFLSLFCHLLAKEATT
jgi:transposase